MIGTELLDDQSRMKEWNYISTRLALRQISVAVSSILALLKLNEFRVLVCGCSFVWNGQTVRIDVPFALVERFVQGDFPHFQPVQVAGSAVWKIGLAQHNVQSRPLRHGWRHHPIFWFDRSPPHRRFHCSALMVNLSALIYNNRRQIKEF